VRTSVIGNDAFQEADTIGVSRPITKHSYLVKDTREIARVVREAFYIASTGRPGPVLIDLPVDTTVNEAEFVYSCGDQLAWAGRLSGDRSAQPGDAGHARL
jgi:acetolactate synthase-1/2/3 large subunit